MSRQPSATETRLGPRPRQVLEVLIDHPVTDRSGRAAQRLQFESGYASRMALAQMVARLESAGLIYRDVRGRRTFRIEITEAGRRAVRPRGSSGWPKDGASDGPRGPARAWGDPEETGAKSTLAAVDASATVPAGDPEAPLDLPGREKMDYDVLAGVLLRTALRAILAQEEAPQASEPLAGPAGRLEDAADRRRRIAKAEARADAAEDALSEAKRRLADLERENRTLQRSNAKLQEQLDRAARIRQGTINVRAMVSPEENQALESLRRELERMMVLPPAGPA